MYDDDDDDECKVFEIRADNIGIFMYKFRVRHR